MSELNFNELPLEILIPIFRLLDGINLKNATLTCKLWNNLIESACRWSTTLYYDPDITTWRSNVQRMNFILTTNRKFGTITIFDGHLSDDGEILKMFQRHGLNVLTLNLYGCRIDNPVLVELLSLTPNLQHAVVRLNELNGLIEVPASPNLTKLKYLEIHGLNPWIMTCFRKSKPTTIRILEDERSSEHYDPLVDFLSSQEMLTSLTSDAHLSSQSALVEIGKLNGRIAIRLTQLAINISERVSSHDHNNLLRFIKTQAESLKELEIGANIPSAVYECVFASMSKLETLGVQIQEIPSSNDFYEGLQENCSVRTIKLMDAGSETQFLSDFLKKLPNVRRLIIPSINVNINGRTMEQNLSKLESLSILTVFHSSFGSVQFSNLKTLHIEHLRVQINWNEFTRIHSRLAELIIVKMNGSFLTSDDIDQITTNVDLQAIRLGVGFVADDRFFEIICRKRTNLRVLELHKSCISHGLSHSVEIDVLRLCDDGWCSKYSQVFQ